MKYQFKKFSYCRREFFGGLLINNDIDVRVISNRYVDEIESGNISQDFKQYLIALNCIEGSLDNYESIDSKKYELQSIEVSNQDNALSAPIEIEFEITNKCNMNCVHCAVGAKNTSKENELTTEQIKDIFEQMKEMKIFAVTLTGGEPFIRPDIFELLHYADNLGIRVHILTNGLLINENNIELIPQNVKIQLSIDGLGEVYDGIRGVGNFDKLEKVISLLKKHNRAFSGCFVYSNKNKENLDATMEYCLKNNIRLKINTLLPFGRAYENLGYLDPELDSDAERLFSNRKIKIQAYRERYAKKFPHGRPLNIFDYFEIFQKSFQACDAGRTDLWITSTGIVYPCPNLAAIEQLPLGSLSESSLSEIWNNKNSEEFRNTYNWSAFSDCQICDIDNYCNQKCMAISYILNDGNFLKCGCTKLLKKVIRKAISENLTDIIRS